jgi:hypothetical protein
LAKLNQINSNQMDSKNMMTVSLNNNSEVSGNAKATPKPFTNNSNTNNNNMNKKTGLSSSPQITTSSAVTSGINSSDEYESQLTLEDSESILISSGVEFECLKKLDSSSQL